MPRITSAALFLVVVGCAGPGPKSPAPAAVLELGEIAVVEDGTPMLKLHANGTSEIGYHHGSLELKPGQTASSDALPVAYSAGPTYAADGAITGKNGKGVHVHADGTIVDMAGKPLPLVVAADRVTFSAQHAAITLAPDGALGFEGGSGTAPPKGLHVEGADTPGKRRAALAFLGVMFSRSGDGAAEPK